MVLHIAPAALGLLALALARAGADGFAMALAVAAVLNAAAGHVAGGIVFLRLRSSSL
ncbi:MAG: hypothetical protein U1F43_31660 [Myxococcota bacterium]